MSKRPIGLYLGLCLIAGNLCGRGVAVAQQSGMSAMTPPKVLVVQVEELKPGKSGSLHEKAESAFVRAMTDAKADQRYLAVNSLSGPQRSLFFFGYDSLAAWEKAEMDMRKNASLGAAIDRASIEDGELLTSYATNVFLFREDYSRKTTVSVATMRYFDITRITVRPGHLGDWEAYLKVYGDAMQKVDPDAHWDTFQSIYGWENGGIYVMITPIKSMEEADHSFANRLKVREAMGEEGLKKMRELAAAAIASSQRNVYRFAPGMSYVPEEWVKADPSFWQHK